MANNRMWLVHSSGERILLAKYYPTTNWYLYHDPGEIDIWFEKFKPKDHTFGDTEFKLEFDTAND